MMKKFLVTFVFIFSAFYSADAQYLRAEAKLGADTVSVGQRFNFDIVLVLPDNETVVEWPEFGDTLTNDVEIVEVGEIEKKGEMQSRRLVLSAFGDGETEIPSQTFSYGRDSILNNNASTRALTVFVNAAAVDTTQSFKPIRMPQRQLITIVEASEIAGAVVIFVGLVVLISYLTRKKKNTTAVRTEKVKEAPKIPAIVTARAKMTEIREQERWNIHDIKQYYTELTDVVREYLEGQFLIDAVEMTSDEILASVSEKKIDENLTMKLKETLTTADLVKFAKAAPSPETGRIDFDDTNAFIEGTYRWVEEKARIEAARKEEKQ